MPREGLLLSDEAIDRTDIAQRLLCTSQAGQTVCNINARSQKRAGELFHTYQNWGKLSLSSCHQRSSSHSCCLALGLLPSFCADLSVDFRVMGAGLEVFVLYLADSSDTVTALRTSVMDVLAEPRPDFRRWWCMERGFALDLVQRSLKPGERGDDRRRAGGPCCTLSDADRAELDAHGIEIQTSTQKDGIPGPRVIQDRDGFRGVIAALRCLVSRCCGDSASLLVIRIGSFYQGSNLYVVRPTPKTVLKGECPVIRAR
jgi:hypothetical protein